MHLEGSSRGQAPATQGPQRHGRDESATASAGPVNAARLAAHEKKGAAPAVLGLLNDRQAADLLGVGERTFLDMIASAEWLPVPIALGRGRAHGGGPLQSAARHEGIGTRPAAPRAHRAHEGHRQRRGDRVRRHDDALTHARRGRPGHTRK